MHYKNSERITLVVVRILEAKEKFQSNFDERWAGDVVFVIDNGNGMSVEGDRRFLGVVSPVFNRMLFGSFRESRQNRVVLEEGVETTRSTLLDFFFTICQLGAVRVSWFITF